jgi:hypothetical protein
MLYYSKIQKGPVDLSFGLPLIRSDPAAFESRLEKRSEFRKQPVGHSRQGDFIKCVEQKVRLARFCVVSLPALLPASPTLSSK